MKGGSRRENRERQLGKGVDERRGRRGGWIEKKRARRKKRARESERNEEEMNCQEI